MMVDRQNDDFEPVAWARGVAIYATTLLVALHLLTALGSVAFSGWPGLTSLAYSSAASLSGALWQWVTYPFLHLGSQHHLLFFAIEMLLFYSFGREVERYLGRRRYLFLYALLILTPPLVMTILGPLLPTAMMGSRDVHFGIFVAFATLYPGVEFFLGLRAKWVAIGLLTLLGLFALAAGDWGSLIPLVVDAGVAWGVVQYLRGALEIPRIPTLFPKRHGKPPRHERKKHPPVGKPAATDDPMAAIDPLLDKIAEEGIGSLTPAERHQLAEARERLMNKPK